MKTVNKIITAVAIILLLLAVSAGEMMTTPNWITFGICLAWLALVAFATFRRRRSHE